MRKKAIRIQLSDTTVVDTCGTGGDGTKTFNISTTTAFVVAGCDVTVAKHGNRSVSSQCGSADVLETLGVNLDVDPEVVEEAIRATGYRVSVCAEISRGHEICHDGQKGNWAAPFSTCSGR